MKNEKGFSLIEVMIAIGLLGIIGVAFLGSLSGASKAVFFTDERATAESLARSQMEYVKEQSYAALYTPDAIPAEYVDYSVTISAVELEVGLQKITVTVKHGTKDVITLEGYKTKR